MEGGGVCWQGREQGICFRMYETSNQNVHCKGGLWEQRFRLEKGFGVMVAFKVMGPDWLTLKSLGTEAVKTEF